MSSCVHGDDCEVEVLARLSGGGAVGRGILCGFSSGAFDFCGPDWPFGYGVPVAWLFLWNLLFVEGFVCWRSCDPLESVEVLRVD